MRDDVRFVVMLAAALGGCGAVSVDPPKAPAAEIPKVEHPESPPEPGMTRIILDANGDDAKVTEVLETAEARSGMSYAFAERKKPVCITPCVVDMKPGVHTLSFESRVDDRASYVDVQVGSRSKAVRHAMGHPLRKSGGEVWAHALTWLGLTVVGTAALAWADAKAEGGEVAREVRGPARAAAFAGLGLMAGGITLMIVSPPTYQPGSTTEIPIPDRGPQAQSP